MLRYSDVSFFGHVDEEPRADLVNGVNVTEAPERFAELLKNTMNDMVAAAADAPSGAKKFATKESSLKNITIYSLVQCTPDLSSSNCDTCLKSAAAFLSICCAGQQGATILYPSCSIRYEPYRFYENSTASVTPGQTPVLLPSPTGFGGDYLARLTQIFFLFYSNKAIALRYVIFFAGNDKRSPTIIFAICASISAVLLLILVGCYWRKRRAKNKYNDIHYEQSGKKSIPLFK